MIKKYNMTQEVSEHRVYQIESYFKYYWANDHLAFFRAEEDMRFFVELPEDIRLEIFTGFLFRPFISTFRKFFEIHKNKNQKHSYFKWQDTNY